MRPSVASSRSRRISPNDVMPDLRVATIQLMRGDAKAYQATCERLFGRVEQIEKRFDRE